MNSDRRRSTGSKTLKGDEEDYEIDTNIKTEQDETLWCTRSGQIMEDFSDAKSIWGI